MVRVVQTSAVVRLSAADFWALRLDSNWDRFCASAEGCTFSLLSLVSTPSPDGEMVAIETQVSAEK